MWGLYCRLECSCRSGSSFAGGGEWGWGWLFFLLWGGGLCILGVRFVGVFKLVVLLTHGDVGLDHVYELLGCWLF